MNFLNKKQIFSIRKFKAYGAQSILLGTATVALLTVSTTVYAQEANGANDNQDAVIGQLNSSTNASSSMASRDEDAEAVSNIPTDEVNTVTTPDSDKITGTQTLTELPTNEDTFLEGKTSTKEDVSFENVSEEGTVSKEKAEDQSMNNEEVTKFSEVGSDNEDQFDLEGSNSKLGNESELKDQMIVSDKPIEEEDNQVDALASQVMSTSELPTETVVTELVNDSAPILEDYFKYFTSELERNVFFFGSQINYEAYLNDRNTNPDKYINAESELDELKIFDIELYNDITSKWDFMREDVILSKESLPQINGPIISVTNPEALDSEDYKNYETLLTTSISNNSSQDLSNLALVVFPSKYFEKYIRVSESRNLGNISEKIFFSIIGIDNLAANTSIQVNSEIQFDFRNPKPEVSYNEDVRYAIIQLSKSFVDSDEGLRMIQGSSIISSGNFINLNMTAPTEKTIDEIVAAFMDASGPNEIDEVSEKPTSYVKVSDGGSSGMRGRILFNDNENVHLLGEETRFILEIDSKVTDASFSSEEDLKTLDVTSKMLTEGKLRSRGDFDYTNLVYYNPKNLNPNEKASIPVNYYVEKNGERRLMGLAEASYLYKLTMIEHFTGVSEKIDKETITVDEGVTAKTYFKSQMPMGSQVQHVFNIPDGIELVKLIGSYSSEMNENTLTKLIYADGSTLEAKTLNELNELLKIKPVKKLILETIRKKAISSYESFYVYFKQKSGGTVELTANVFDEKRQRIDTGVDGRRTSYFEMILGEKPITFELPSYSPISSEDTINSQIWDITSSDFDQAGEVTFFQIDNFSNGNIDLMASTVSNLQSYKTNNGTEKLADGKYLHYTTYILTDLTFNTIYSTDHFGISINTHELHDYLPGKYSDIVTGYTITAPYDGGASGKMTEYTEDQVIKTLSGLGMNIDQAYALKRSYTLTDLSQIATNSKQKKDSEITYEPVEELVIKPTEKVDKNFTLKVGPNWGIENVEVVTFIPKVGDVAGSDLTSLLIDKSLDVSLNGQDVAYKLLYSNSLEPQYVNEHYVELGTNDWSDSYTDIDAVTAFKVIFDSPLSANDLIGINYQLKAEKDLRDGEKAITKTIVQASNANNKLVVAAPDSIFSILSKQNMILSGQVFSDDDLSNSFTKGDNGIIDVTLVLWQQNKDGKFEKTTKAITSNDPIKGNFKFDNLDSGTYRVQVVMPKNVSATNASPNRLTSIDDKYFINLSGNTDFKIGDLVGYDKIEVSDLLAPLSVTQKARFIIKDETANKELYRKDLSGLTGEAIGHDIQTEIDSYLAKGYEVKTSPSYDSKQKYTSVISDIDEFIYVLVHGTQTSEESKDISRTIKYVFKEDQSQAAPNKIQTITFKREVTENKVTGEKEFGTWKSDSNTLGAVESPLLSGYTADKLEVTSVTLMADDENIVEVVTYIKHGEKVEVEEQTIPFETERVENANLAKGEEKVIQKGKEGMKVIKTVTPTLNGEPSGEPIVTEEVIQAPVKAIIEVGTGKVPEKPQSLPETPLDEVGSENPVESNSEVTEDKEESLVSSKISEGSEESELSRAGALPNTGDTRSFALFSGAVLSILGGLFLAVPKKKENQE